MAMQGIFNSIDLKNPLKNILASYLINYYDQVCENNSTLDFCFKCNLIRKLAAIGQKKICLLQSKMYRFNLRKTKSFWLIKINKLYVA